MINEWNRHPSGGWVRQGRIAWDLTIDTEYFDIKVDGPLTCHFQSEYSTSVTIPTEVITDLLATQGIYTHDIHQHAVLNVWAALTDADLEVLCKHEGFSLSQVAAEEYERRHPCP